MTYIDIDNRLKQSVLRSSCGNPRNNVGEHKVKEKKKGAKVNINEKDLKEYFANPIKGRKIGLNSRQDTKYGYNI